MSILKWLSSRHSIRGMVLSHYKRGLARTKMHDVEGALNEFTLAIETADAPVDVKAMALYNRALLFADAEDHAKAVADLTAVLTAASPLPEIKRAAKRRLERIQYRHGLSRPS
jgi:hypothetical protein